MAELFPNRLPSSVSLKRQIACVSRELAMREHVYPGLVRKKTMTWERADEEIACIKAVLDTLRGLEEQRRRG